MALCATGPLCHWPILADRHKQLLAFQAPVLMVPLADGLAQHREHAKGQRTFPDGASITEHLILDGARQRGGEVLGARAFATVGQHVCVQGGYQHIDRADVLLTVRDSARQCARKRAACSGVG